MLCFEKMSLSGQMITSRCNLLQFKNDFGKARHQRLLLKLKAYGIGNGTMNWVEQMAY